MPLPEPNAAWPPQGHKEVWDAIRVWDAWYTANREKLAQVYGAASPHPGSVSATFYASEGGGWVTRPSQYAGGIVGTIARWFWGQPQHSTGSRASKLHVPAAADIATTSANLLFGEPPALTVEDDEAAQDRLDELFTEQLWTQLVSAAELAAGLGGVYLRVGWDTEVADHPLVSVIGPDCAVPKFRWSKLSEVTFSWVLYRDAKDGVLRHLEHHAPGVVEHALYLGDDDHLGHPVPLTDHPATEPLIESLNAEGVVSTGLDRLDVIYVPNVPARDWRNHPIASHFGAPDIAGVEPLLDALDECWTSWMRDIRLGKGRLVVPQSYLDNLGRGQGGMLDLDREVFVGVEALPGGGGMELSATQFAIRFQEHSATAAALWEQIVNGCGYSAQTFGLTGDVAMTATEAHARERKTVHTRSGKIRRWTPALGDLSELLLAIDQLVFGGKVAPVRPDIEFDPLARDNPEQLARTAQMLRAAEAASTETLIRMVHPEWDQEQVDNEIRLLAGEKQSAEPTVPDELDDLEAGANPAQMREAIQSRLGTGTPITPERGRP